MRVPMKRHKTKTASGDVINRTENNPYLAHVVHKNCQSDQPTSVMQFGQCFAKEGDWALCMGAGSMADVVGFLTAGLNVAAFDNRATQVREGC